MSDQERDLEAEGNADLMHDTVGEWGGWKSPKRDVMAMLRKFFPKIDDLLKNPGSLLTWQAIDKLMKDGQLSLADASLIARSLYLADSAGFTHSVNGRLSDLAMVHDLACPGGSALRTSRAMIILRELLEAEVAPKTIAEQLTMDLSLMATENAINLTREARELKASAGEGTGSQRAELLVGANQAIANVLDLIKQMKK